MFNSNPNKLPLEESSYDWRHTAAIGATVLAAGALTLGISQESTDNDTIVVCEQEDPIERDYMTDPLGDKECKEIPVSNKSDK